MSFTLIQLGYYISANTASFNIQHHSHNVTLRDLHAHIFTASRHSWLLFSSPSHLPLGKKSFASPKAVSPHSVENNILSVSLWISCSEEWPRPHRFSADHMHARLRTTIKSQSDRQLHWAVLSCTVKRCVDVCTLFLPVLIVALCSFCSLQEKLHSLRQLFQHAKSKETRTHLKL